MKSLESRVASLEMGASVLLFGIFFQNCSKKRVKHRQQHAKDPA